MYQAKEKKNKKHFFSVWQHKVDLYESCWIKGDIMTIFFLFEFGAKKHKTIFEHKN